MRVVVIGGGAAGMMAAGAAAENGRNVTLLEQNDRPGRKLYLTGKGRCNVTNASDTETMMANINTNSRFLHSALNRFGSDEVIRFFEANGVPLKTERGRRVFPVSDRSADIVNALTRYIRTGGVNIETNCRVLSLDITAESENKASNTNASQERVSGVHSTRGYFPADAVIVATGGLSYPTTGATGDGYRFARAAGHGVTPLYPALASITAAEPWIAALEGLSLKNIRITVTLTGQKKPCYTEMGEMLFTQNGVSGPVILSASRYITAQLPRSPRLWIDLKPALSPSVLDERILRDFQARTNKHFANAMEDLLPKRLIETVILLSGIPPDKRVNTITRAERQRLGEILKGISLTPIAVGGYGEAVITMGGVNVREIDPSTMRSKKVNGLYFAGEVLDIDAMTGGYNLQVAFSTGYAAGKSV